MKISFEDYLEQKYFEEVDGTENCPNDDDLPDAFSAWLCDLHVDTLILYADIWALGLVKKHLSETSEKFLGIINKAFEERKA